MRDVQRATSVIDSTTHLASPPRPAPELAFLPSSYLEVGPVSAQAELVLCIIQQVEPPRLIQPRAAPAGVLERSSAMRRAVARSMRGGSRRCLNWAPRCRLPRMSVPGGINKLLF